MSRLSILFFVGSLSVCSVLYPGDLDTARSEPYYYLRACTGELRGAKRDNLSALRDRFSPEKHKGLLKKCDCSSRPEQASLVALPTVPVLHLLCDMCSKRGDQEAQQAFYGCDPRSCAEKISQYKINAAAAYGTKE